jgi:uncharacterized protein
MPTVAIIGASTDPTKYGNRAIRAYVRQGYTVYPVNPKFRTIEGLRAYASVSDIPGPIDRVSLYLPPEIGVTVLPGIAEKKPAEFFVNPGAESSELMEKAQTLGLEPIFACSIVEIGETPEVL